MERLGLLRDGEVTYSRRVSFEEHTGTHLDAPGHVLVGAPLVHELDPAHFIAPVSVVDVAAECGGDPDFVIGARHLERFESRCGAIPERSIVLARTGWERFLGTPAYVGEPSFPGFDASAVDLVLERRVVGLGIDSPGIEPGSAHDLPLHRRTASAGVYHLEGLVQLEHVPPNGATLFVGVPPLVDGSGVPVRVLALVG